MTAQTMNSFMSSLSENQSLANGLYAAVADLEGQAAEHAVVDFANANGFVVDHADVAKMRSECIAAVDGNRDLSDEDLEGVDGGIAIETATIAAAIIGGGAVLAAAGVGVAGAAGAAGIGGAAAIVSSLITAGNNPIGDWFKQW